MHVMTIRFMSCWIAKFDISPVNTYVTCFVFLILLRIT